MLGVLDEHLRKSQDGAVQVGLACNYAEDIVVLISHGIYREHGGLRQLADMLFKTLPNPVFDYLTRLVNGDVGFLESSDHGDDSYVNDGADSAVIRNGKIAMQTIRYTVKRNTASVEALLLLCGEFKFE